MKIKTSQPLKYHDGKDIMTDEKEPLTIGHAISKDSHSIHQPGARIGRRNN